jgi:hypothetical protein
VKKKKRLCHSLDLQPVTAPVVVNLDDNHMGVGLEDVMEGGGGVRTARYVVEEGDDEEEEEVLPLVWREQRSKACSNTSNLAAVEMMNIRGLTMFAIDGVLEDTIPEDLMLELPEIRVVDVRTKCLDEVSYASLLAGPEVGLPVYPSTSDP